jgi:hypothetical protein
MFSADAARRPRLFKLQAICKLLGGIRAGSALIEVRRYNQLDLSTPQQPKATFSELSKLCRIWFYHSQHLVVNDLKKTSR